MIKKGIIGLFLCFLFTVQAVCTDIFFSGEYRNVPFDQFVRDVEEITGARFFYKTGWTTGVRITAKGDSLSLARVLQDNLAGKDLYIHIDEGRNVFITPEILVDIQPEEPGSDQEAGPQEQYDARLTYFGGREAEVIETLTIGDAKNNPSGKPAFINGKIWDKENRESLVGATV